MPARVVRAEINSSDSLSKVSLLADLTFRALLVAADDFGRLDGRLPVLRGMLFPLRDQVTTKKLAEWLDELAAGLNPLIQLYEVDGRPFVALLGWEKHRGNTKRAKSSRFPEPPPRRSADPREIPGDPPESRSGSRESRVGIERDPRGEPRRSVCVCPDHLEEQDRESGRAWAAANGFTPEQLAYAWARVRDWSRSKREKRADWLATLRNAMSEGWALKGYTAPASSGGGRYRPAEDVIAAAKQRQAEDDARARESSEEADQVGKVIELSLRQAAGSAVG